MVDIKELMRTYVFINDPDVKQVTTKFGILLVALGGVAGMAWLAVGVAEDPASEQAASADGDAYESTECMEQTELSAWKATHAGVVDDGDYEVEPVGAGIVCVHW